MKRISVRLFIALLAFVIGVTFTAFWMLYGNEPNVPIPKSEILLAQSFAYNSQISPAERSFWEKKILGRFKELSLEKSFDSADETYRLTLLPTFDEPIMVRVGRAGNERYLVAKKLNGKGGFGLEKFGKLSYEKKRTLTEEEWLGFIKLLDESMFWDLPSLDKNDEPIIDGADWVVEGFKDKKFHEIHRVSPSADFRLACAYLLNLSGFGSEYKDY